MNRLLPLADRRFDLLVVGAGIFGAGVAREAALNGLSVALVEQGDLGEHTSSRSSKLIHGGLRYLESFEFKLVKQALRERAVQWELAPHLVSPLPFLVPIYRGASPGRMKLSAGLFLYDWLAGFPSGFTREMLDRKEMLAREPLLCADGLRSGGRYFDWQVHDSRLVSEVVLQAREGGAAVTTRTKVLSLDGGPPGRYRATVRDEVSGNSTTLEATAVACTTGPWSDQFRRSIGGGSDGRVRLTSGTHVIVPKLFENHALLLRARSDGRVFFVIPYFGRTLIGTTDRDFDGDPASACPALQDVDYLIDETNHVLGGKRLARSDIISAFTGIRTLAMDGKDLPSKTSREQTIFEGPPRCWHILGGKLTTWRLIARELLECLSRSAGFGIDDGTKSRSTPLPGGCFGRSSSREETTKAIASASGVDPLVASRVFSWAGSRASAALSLARVDRRFAVPIGSTLPETASELLYIAREELAESLVDILRRRLPRLLLNRVSPEDLQSAANLLGRELGWSEARRASEVKDTLRAQVLPFSTSLDVPSGSR